MGESWPFKKAKNGHEAGSSGSKKKPERNRLYVKLGLGIVSPTATKHL
jgi:hypothetical protein